MLTDNMSWIAGYKCKKEEVQQDYEEIIKMLTQMNFEKSNPHEWNIEISTHKIRMKGTLENYGMIIKKPQQEAKNIVLSTLSNYVIVYTNWNTNSSHLFYSSIDEAQNEMPNCIIVLSFFNRFLIKNRKNKNKLF